MRANYRFERKHFPVFRGRVHRRRAKAIIYLASRYFRVPRPAVIGGRWNGGGTYLKDGLGEYIGRPAIKLTFSRCYSGVIFHEFAHHLQFCETGKTNDDKSFIPYLVRVWRWAWEVGIARRVFTPLQVEKIANTVIDYTEGALR